MKPTNRRAILDIYVQLPTSLSDSNTFRDVYNNFSDIVRVFLWQLETQYFAWPYI